MEVKTIRVFVLCMWFGVPRFLRIRIDSVINAVDLLDEILVDFIEERVNNSFFSGIVRDFCNHAVTIVIVDQPGATQLGRPFLARTQAVHGLGEISAHFTTVT